MQAVRGSRVRMSAHSAVFRGGTAPPASPGARGSTAHTRSSGHGSTVTFRRILCSKRCLCSASTTELSHSRRKVGCSPERSGSLRGDEGVAGLTERRACSRVPAMVAVPPQCTSPLGPPGNESTPHTQGGSHRNQSGRGRTGLGQTGAKQGLGTTVASGGQGEVRRHRRPLESQNLPPPALRSTKQPVDFGAGWCWQAEELGGQQTADAGEMHSEATLSPCPLPTSAREALQPGQGPRAILTPTPGSPHPVEYPRFWCH